MISVAPGLPVQGLSAAEAATRLARDGYNELPSGERRSLLETIWHAVREPMFLLLIGCVLLYFLVGALHDALSLAPFVLLVVGITVFQARRTENALAALRTLSSPRARVLRDGVVSVIAARDLVVGDAILVEAGDRVPADARLVQATTLEVDESLLTGESVAVAKAVVADAAGDDRSGRIHSGTLVVRGHAVAEVVATGPRTEVGRIGASLASIVPPRTPLQREVATLVRSVGTAGLLVCTIVVVVYGLTRGDWVAGMLAGLTLALSMIPEEFPAVFTIFIALAAWSMARRNVLTRQPPAVEALSGVSVLCVDKTGTLTENRMRVQRLVVDGERWNAGAASAPLAPSFRLLVEHAVLASAPSSTDPMEQALHDLERASRAAERGAPQEGLSLLREYPLTAELLAVSQLWTDQRSGARLVATKGAPEAIVDLCHLDPTRMARALEHADIMARDGLRVLGVARGIPVGGALPERAHDVDFEFLGLVGFADPLRADAAHAVAECHEAGIRVIMITGDHPETAAAIARQAGIEAGERVITGSEIEGLDDEMLARRLDSANVFARTTPAHKLRLVEALKQRGEVIAMTGDGVNDAPALKAAHVGLAMGRRGTEVAREAAGLVIADDDFSSIVAGVRAGRRVFDNLRKATRFIVAVHIPIAGLSLLPVLLGWPLLLLPAHVAFLELVIDPACSLAFEAEPEEPNIMRRPPRRMVDRMLDTVSLRVALLQGLIAFAAVAGIVLLSRSRGHDESVVRALGFTTLVLTNVGLIVANRSLHTGLDVAVRAVNRPFWIVSLLAIGTLTTILGVDWLRGLFHFGAVEPADLGVAAGAAGAALLLFLAIKPRPPRAARRRRSDP
ncbi:MAG: cation-translocating P-type ATPase [Steroidobacteraceae bacterium]